MIPKIKRILYTTDLSPNSEYAFRYAINSAIKHEAKIIILHVIEPIASAMYIEVGFIVGEEQAKEIFEKGASIARDRVKKRLKIFSEKELANDPEAADRVQSIEICEGYPAEAILQKADELDCDAIVMGTHGKGIVANTFLGSVSKRVLRRTRKPVFIIPLPRGETDLTVHDDF
jgi:nucleotide-binding universal stress UspA family protein